MPDRRPILFNGPVLPFMRKRDAGRAWEMKAAAGAGEVYLYGDIGDPWGDGITARQFAQDLKDLGTLKTLDVYINSAGGSVVDGVGIHNILKRQSATKTVHIDGLAASIASVIAMAGDEIRIAANGMMMIHDPWAMAVGTAEEMRKTADALDKVRGTLLQTYVDRTSSTEQQLSDWMTAETWFNAQEAVDAGLADTISEDVAMAALARHDFARFNHVPEPLVAAVEAAAEEPTQTADPPEPHKLVASMAMRLAKRKNRTGQPS